MRYKIPPVFAAAHALEAQINALEAFEETQKDLPDEIKSNWIARASEISKHAEAMLADQKALSLFMAPDAEKRLRTVKLKLERHQIELIGGSR